MEETIDQPTNTPEPFSQRIVEVYGSPDSYTGYFRREGLQFESEKNKTVFDIQYINPHPFDTDPTDRPKETRDMSMMSFRRKDNMTSERIEIAKIKFDGTISGNVDFIRFVNTVLQNTDVTQIGSDSNIATSTEERQRRVEVMIIQRQNDLQEALNKYYESQRTAENK